MRSRFDLVRKDGQLLPTLVSAIQRRDASGRPVVQRLTVFNATERRRYEQELLRAKQAAEQAASDLQRSQAALATERDRLRQILDVLPVAVLHRRCRGAGACWPTRGAGAGSVAVRSDSRRPAPTRRSARWTTALWLRRPDGTPYPRQELPAAAGAPGGRGGARPRRRSSARPGERTVPVLVEQRALA